MPKKVVVYILAGLGILLVSVGLFLVMKEGSFRSNNMSESLRSSPSASLTTASNLTSRSYLLKGLYCDSCIRKTVDTVSKINGVKGVSIQPDMKSMTVTYVRGKVLPKQVFEAVSKAGFSAEIPDGESKIEVLKFNISVQ